MYIDMRVYVKSVLKIVKYMNTCAHMFSKFVCTYVKSPYFRGLKLPLYLMSRSLFKIFFFIINYITILLCNSGCPLFCVNLVLRYYVLLRRPTIIAIYR